MRHDGRASHGPILPTTWASVTHRPLDGHRVRLTGGILHEWQRRNRDVSLPLAIKHLDRAGNLANLRLAIAATAPAGRAATPTGPGTSPEGVPGYRGPVFMDSDLYKTLEAIGWEAAHGPVETLTAFADESTDLLARAQQPDGYLNSYVQVTGEPRYATLATSHELYCAGHLVQAALAHSRGRGDTRLLEIAARFADHLVATFAGRAAGLDGHPIVETALVELYRETGVTGYLDLARQFVDQRGHGLVGDSGRGRRYLQDHRPVRETTEEVGHAVRALYLEQGVVDVAVETGDDDLLASSITRWEDMVTTKTALTGGNGSRHADEAFGDSFELPPDRAYNETCAAIASFQWSWRLLLATGDSRYADLMERVLFNAFAAAVSADGARFFYVNPLQRRHDHFERDDPGRRREWFSCACCPPNAMRLIASLEHYLATTAGDTVYLHQFADARITADLAGGVLDVDVATGYPWTETVDLQVRGAPDSERGVAVRIPGWARRVAVFVNGEPCQAARASRGYLVIRRRWRPGDVLTVNLDLTPRITVPHRRIDALRGSAAVERGPLVYCFEQVDQPPGVSVDDLALRPPVDTAAVDAARPARPRLTTRPRVVDGVGPTVTVETDAIHLPPDPPRGLPYGPPARSADGEPVTATAIPYFQWDNRDGGAMRVWLPVGERPPAPSTG